MNQRWPPRSTPSASRSKRCSTRRTHLTSRRSACSAVWSTGCPAPRPLARQGQPIIAFVTQAAGAASTPGANTAIPVARLAESVDVLLDLNLDENRELLTEFHAEAIDHLQQSRPRCSPSNTSLTIPRRSTRDLPLVFIPSRVSPGSCASSPCTPWRTRWNRLLDLARNQKLRLKFGDHHPDSAEPRRLSMRS